MDRVLQFSVRFSRFGKFTLEILARHAGVSLAQLLEGLVDKEAANYELGGKTVSELVGDNTTAVFDRMNSWKKDKTDRLWLSSVLHQTLTSNAFWVLSMPEELRNEGERLFCKAVDLLEAERDVEGRDALVEDLVSHRLDAFLDHCLGAQEGGLTPPMLASQYQALMEAQRSKG